MKIPLKKIERIDNNGKIESIFVPVWCKNGFAGFGDPLSVCFSDIPIERVAIGKRCLLCKHCMIRYVESEAARLHRFDFLDMMRKRKAVGLSFWGI